MCATWPLNGTVQLEQKPITNGNPIKPNEMRTPIHPEEHSLQPVGAFEVRPKYSYIGIHDHPRATGSQAPPPGSLKVAFGTVWSPSTMKVFWCPGVTWIFEFSVDQR